MTETQTLPVSTDLTPSEVATFLFDEHGLVGPQAALSALKAAWPVTFSGVEADHAWWLGYLSATWDARFGFDTYVTDEEAADDEFPFFAGYRAAEAAR